MADEDEWDAWAGRGAERRQGLAHVLITAWDEDSAYRVFDALVECFPGIGPPCPRPVRPGRVALAVVAPTLGRGPGPLPL